MPALIPWILAAALIPTPSTDSGTQRRIDVNCQLDQSLQRAIARARKVGGEVDIYIHGVCEGNFVIDTNGIALRAAGAGSGLAARKGASSYLPVLEVVDAVTYVRGLRIRGGDLGILARGWDASVVLVEVDVQARDAGVVAYRGADLHILDSTVHDGNVGVGAGSSADLSLWGVTVTDAEIGVIVSQHSSAVVNNSTIKGNRVAGLAVYSRSDVAVYETAFGDNGQVHVHAGEWSQVQLNTGVTIGSKDDATPSSLSANIGARIASGFAPETRGHISALDGASIFLRSTALIGDVYLYSFSNANIGNATVHGSVYCSAGAEAICSSTTTQGNVGCPSPTCGTPTGEAVSRPTPLPKPPVIEMPRFKWLQRAGPPN